MNIEYNVAKPVVSLTTNTTDGEMYVIFVEDDNGQCQRVMVTIGKTGSAIRAWTEALTEVVNVALASGVTLSHIAVNLSNISTDRWVQGSDRSKIYSGPDGFVYLVNRYIRHKNKATIIPFDMPWVNDDDD